MRALGLVVPGLLTLALLAPAVAAQEPRARDLGVPFRGRPGPLNAVTDVAGVGVGHATLIRGRGALVVGEGPVRTGVTAVVPRMDAPTVPVFAAWFTLNGNGEMTGTTWVEDSSLLEGPVMITNTLSVGAVHHAVIAWGVRRARETGEPMGPHVAALPVVAETWDGSLNDIYGQHVAEEHAFRALEGAAGGPVAEGNVGGGTGMICHRFKGGIGTSSRVVQVLDERYTVGVLVQCNYGGRAGLRIAGVPVGREIPDLMPERASGGTGADAPDGEAPAPAPPGAPGPTPAAGGSMAAQPPERAAPAAPSLPGGRDGSIIVVVATDAPVLPQQLKRMARRVSMALGRMGSVSSNSSGDIFIAFTTANREAARGEGRASLTTLPNGAVTPLFGATIQATEEAVVNALVAAETMTGADGLTVHELPHERLREILRRYNRLEGGGG